MNKNFSDQKEIELYYGDCFDVISKFESNSVDYIVTDPPYGQTNESYDGKNAVSLKSSFWKECYRVCKENAALVSFAGSPTYHKIASSIEEGGWKIRQMWAWVYKDGFITSAYPKEGFDRLSPSMDPIVFATKGKVIIKVKREGEPWEMNKERKKGISERSGVSKLKSASGHYQKTIVSDGESPFEYFMSPRCSSKKGYKTEHPNQKPLHLMEWILEKFTEGIVLDPFCGSGTTGEAAINLGHKFIGVECNEEYLEISKKRFSSIKERNKSIFDS